MFWKKKIELRCAEIEKRLDAFTCKLQGELNTALKHINDKIALEIYDGQKWRTKQEDLHAKHHQVMEKWAEAILEIVKKK